MYCGASNPSFKAAIQAIWRTLAQIQLYACINVNFSIKYSGPMRKPIRIPVAECDLLKPQ